MMEAAATNCGLMIPQTPQLGGWLISTADWQQYPGYYMAILVGDTLYFSAMMEAAAHELWAMDMELSTASRTTEQRF